MLRYITAIFLLGAFDAQTFDKAVMMLDYYANRAVFAKNCENKAIPNLHCNGKCQMMKKIKEEQKRDQQNPERKAEHKDQVSSSKSFFATLQINGPDCLKCLDSIYFPALPIDRSFSIFHPPATV
jgi:hypothetical protein